MAIAEEAGLDLVEVSPTAKPPVCKVLDLGRFKYEAQKKANEAKKKQKIIEVKEIKIRLSISPHDYNVKLRAMQKFFESGCKVKVTLRFRGREITRQQFGRDLLARLKDDSEDFAKVESEPKMEGRQMIMVLGPK